MLLTVFTPTYNRKKFIRRIYDSLLQQSFSDFEWLIIDDGSKDNTAELVEEVINEERFRIRYIYKENGGKHSAINLAAKESHGKYILWLDSDDWILPHALDDFKNKLENAEFDESISAVVGIRVDINHKSLGSYIPSMDIDGYFLDLIQKYRIKGDYSWAIKKSVLEKFPFPIYEGENFCTEGLVLNRISQQYKTRFVSTPVIIGDYISGGLTDQIHKLTRNNPLGFMTYYKELCQSHQARMPLKIWAGTLYWVRRYESTKNIPESLCPNNFLRLMKIPSYVIWKLYNLILRGKKKV